MKAKQILALFVSLLWLTGCSDSSIFDPVAIDFTQEESLNTLLGEDYPYNRSLTKMKTPAAQIVYASDGTYYECVSGEIYAATGDEYLYGGCRVWNDFEASYTLKIIGPHRFVLSELNGSGVPTVQIANPIKVDYRNDAGKWVAITADTTISTRQLRVRGNGSGSMSTSAKTEIHSGYNEN